LEFGDVCCGGRKTRIPGEKTPRQGGNQQQTQPTYGTGPEFNPVGGMVGGERSKYRAIPASKVIIK